MTAIFSTGVLFASRRTAVVSVMATVCYITLYQRVELAGLDFTALRIVLLIGMVRIIIRGELRDLKLNMIDWLVIAYPTVVTFVAMLRTGNKGELVYQCGVSYDILLSYFIFRILLNNQKDVDGFLDSLAFLIAPLAIFMIVESITGRNLISGSRDLAETYVRSGRIRCRGGFLGPITAGIFGATLMPLFVSLFRPPDRHRAAIIGVLSAMAVTYASNSSGPLMAFFSGVIGLLFWPMRQSMRAVQWGVVVMLLLAHLYMKAPVWYIFDRIGDLIGGDGWHRSYLIEQTISHFSDWWLLGTSNTGEWMPYKMLSGQADITNQYVLSAISGGLAGLILFVLIIVMCFRNLGIALRESRHEFPGSKLFLWCLGSVLFAHVVALFSVTYFDQMHVVWWGFLGMISSATSDVLPIDSRLPHRESPSERITGKIP